MPAGTWLITEGDPAESAFVLVGGRMDAYREGLFVNDLRPGAIIGELGLLTEGTRAASVRARRDSTVLELSRADFQTVIFGDPQALVPLIRTIADRLARPLQAAARGESQPTVIAVVAAHPGAATEDVGAVLGRALGAAGRLAMSRGLDMGALQQAERDNDRVLLVADGRDVDWEQFCSGRPISCCWSAIRRGSAGPGVPPLAGGAARRSAAVQRCPVRVVGRGASGPRHDVHDR